MQPGTLKSDVSHYVFPSYSKNPVPLDRLLKTAYLNLMSFYLLRTSSSSEANGLSRAWWHTSCVRISLRLHGTGSRHKNSILPPVIQQNLTYAPPSISPKFTHSKILNADFIPILRKSH